MSYYPNDNYQSEYEKFMYANSIDNNSTPKKRTQEIIYVPETPTKKQKTSKKGKEKAEESPSLKRQNAFIITSSLETPKESISFPSTPTFDIIQSDEEQETPKFEWIIPGKTPPKNNNNIPQVDGADDLLTDEQINSAYNKKHKKIPYTNSQGRVYFSAAQEVLIESQIREVLKINKQIRELKGKISNSKDFQENYNFKTRIELLFQKKNNLIKKYNLTKWNWYDDTDYYDPKKCWYCNSGVINQCSCDGYWKMIDPDSKKEIYNEKNEKTPDFTDEQYEHYKENDRPDYQY